MDQGTTAHEYTTGYQWSKEVPWMDLTLLHTDSPIVTPALRRLYEHIKIQMANNKVPRRQVFLEIAKPSILWGTD